MASAETLPYWAIGAFAGLRSAELERLEWRDIRWAGGLVEVGAHKAKSASKRLVKILQMLDSWLKPYSRRSQGLIAPQSFNLLRKALLADRQAGRHRGMAL